MSTFHIQRPDGSRRHVGGYKHKERPGARQFEPSHLDASDLPSRVDLRPHLTAVEDQGDTNSCTANATAGAFEYLVKQHAQADWDVSRMFIYYNARRLEGDDIEDEGSAISDAVEGLKKFGACAEDTWPFDKRHVNQKPSSTAYGEAKAEHVDDMEQVPTELDAWRHCLAEGRPIIFGLTLFDSFDKARKGKVPLPNDKEQQRGKHGKHAMLCVGYSDTDELFIVRNSWGSDWGDDGYCYIPYDYMMNDELNSGDSWVIRHLEGVAQPDRTTWGDDSSILPSLDGELHKMDDVDYQVMLEALGEVALESRIALLYLVAAGADGDLAEDEVAAVAAAVQKVHDELGSEYAAEDVLAFVEKHIGDEKLIEESIVLLGAHLSRGMLASILQSMKAIAGADGELAEEEREFIASITEVWEIGAAAQEEAADEDAEDEDDEAEGDEEEDDEDGEDDDEDDDEEDDEDEEEDDPA